MAGNFKLQALLKYRKTLEEQAQQKLAELLNVEMHLKARLEEIGSQLVQLTTELEVRQQQGLNVLELRLYEDQIEHQRQLAEQLGRRLHELEEQVATRREELLVAARERKMIEKLKEKQLAEYLRGLDRKERTLLDEISLRQKGGPL